MLSVLTTKTGDRKEIFRDDDCVGCLDHGDGFVGVCICSNSFDCIL